MQYAGVEGKTSNALSLAPVSCTLHPHKVHKVVAKNSC